MTALNHLFSPIQLGTMTVKNRLVMPPMSVNFGVDEQGFLTEQHTAYLEARAKHGTGMIVVGGGAVHRSGLDLPRMPWIWDDKYIPAMAELTERIQNSGAKLGMQLLHGGRQAYLAEKVAPSPLPSLGVVKEMPRELNVEEIKELVSAHGDAARRCQQAGMDFVEIHGAHGYLIAEFLAPLSNLRTDEYGGPFENRIRFLLEILADIKAKTGPDFPVGVRYNGDDCIENGWTPAESIELAPILEANGADWLHISAGIYGSNPLTIPSMYAPFGCFLHLAEGVKKAVKIPVIAVGRIKDPRMADSIIAQGQADMVAMGRSHLADPALAAKAYEGRFDEIRPCIGCCMGCIDRALALEEATCVMNPEVNREYVFGDMQPAEESKRVLVIGAGPAGLAAARMAALRGHAVTLAEEGPRVGGLLFAASKAPGREELMDLVNFYDRELKRLKVQVLLDAKVDSAFLESVDPQAVVVSTGSLMDMPQVTGLFDTEMELHTTLEVLEGLEQTGPRVVVLGGGVAGLTTADFLAGQGKEVAVLNRDAHYATEISSNDRGALRERLKRPEIQLYKNVAIREFKPDGLAFKGNGSEVEIEGFTDLVIAEGRRSTRTVIDLLKKRGIEPYIIGDAKGPRSLLESQTEADEVGRSI